MVEIHNFQTPWLAARWGIAAERKIKAIKAQQQMVNYLQGDIFKAITERRFDLAVVFGHVGFNEMAQSWRRFREGVPTWSNVDNPFTDFGDPHQLGDGTWLWFVPEQDNHGMTDQVLESVIQQVMRWADEQHLRSVITNGIADIDHTGFTADNRASDDRRARFLINLLTPYAEKGLRVAVISLNDVFVR